MVVTPSPIKIIDGIPFFSEDRYWGKAPKEDLEQAIAVIEEQGWDAFKKRFKDRFDATFEENRADWRFPIPLTKHSVVLDAGAGMGRISIPLARVAGKVVSVDQSFLRMKFLKKRAELEELGNIETYVGDLLDLPFPKESFDLIVMNGLLEWIGATDRCSDPREAQIASLKICKDLLKPGGYLYIGIENRVALTYLYALDHSGLRFTSYLPRVLTDAYMRLRKGKRYDTYTYTKKGYEKLLDDAGLTKVDFYLVYPGYNCPRITIPYQRLDLLNYVIRALLPENTWRRRVARQLAGIRPLLALYRHVFFSFNIIIQK